MPFIYSLCSSSKGNSCYIGDNKNGILIDAGLSFTRLKKLLQERDVPIEAIKSIFITHEHSDHISGLAMLTKNINAPVYATSGTLCAIQKKNAVCEKSDLRELDRSPAECGDFTVRSFRTPHDSACSSGYKITMQTGKTVCVCTDLGIVTPEVYEQLYRSDIVLLEANYDRQMLVTGSYPGYLKRRIASDIGHLSNTDSADTILNLFNDGTSHFLLGHLSEQNNFPYKAKEEVNSIMERCGAVLGDDYTLKIAAGTVTTF